MGKSIKKGYSLSILSIYTDNLLPIQTINNSHATIYWKMMISYDGGFQNQAGGVKREDDIGINPYNANQVIMNILLTNDDGIFAPGLQVLYQIFSKDHQVTVVAPDREKSAVGHGITLNHPIRVSQVDLPDGKQGYAVGGTPVDCVKLAFLELLEKKPDMVVSGINRGANLGVNLNYSGTAAAAREAALYRIPAIAASVQGQKGGDFLGAAQYVQHLSEEVFEKGLPKRTFLNVNFPALPFPEITGVRICRLGLSFPDEYLDRRKDPRDRTYYWHGCEFRSKDTDPAIDSAAVDGNYISITPVKCDMTDYDAIQSIEAWESLNLRAKLDN